ncbi:DUF6691 family protein [Serratia marcescens]|uniref:DUF6691 family protein n=1 Tax=Serratia marcescens TaxID=615 RepID=UPI0027DAF03F|nr:DUF6691 family protein [Serratia marcescens]
MIDRRLVIGAAIFGLGWGLAGLCPGPAIALLGTGQPFAIIFATAMIAGVLLHGLIHRPTATTGTPCTSSHSPPSSRCPASSCHRTLTP